MSGIYIVNFDHSPSPPPSFRFIFPRWRAAQLFGVHNPKRCIFQAFPSVFLCNFPPFLSLIHFFPYISLWYVTSSMMKSLAFTRLFRIFLLGRSSSSSWKQKIFSVYLILIIFIKNVRSQITFVSFSIFLLLADTCFRKFQCSSCKYCVFWA